jgi:F0F1-type ATP synthase membrane subunit b/b'
MSARAWQRLAGVLTVVLRGLLGAAPCTAATGHATAHVASVTDLLFPVINFAIFSVIIAKYVVPAMREYLRRRSDDAANAAQESAAALRAAEDAIATVRRRHARLADERESIVRDLVAAAARQAERLRGQAEEGGARRLADARLVAEQERRRALAAARAEIADLATRLAESRLRAALTADDQHGFVRQFLKDAPAR